MKSLKVNKTIHVTGIFSVFVGKTRIFGIHVASRRFCTPVPRKGLNILSKITLGSAKIGRLDGKKLHESIGAHFRLKSLEIPLIFMDFYRKNSTCLFSTSWSLGKRLNGSYSVITWGSWTSVGAPKKSNIVKNSRNCTENCYKYISIKRNIF